MKECVSEGVGVFSNFSPNDEVGITGGLISAGLTKSLSSGLLSILSYAGDKISDGQLKYLGPVRLSIGIVEQLDAQSCKIGYIVDGLHEYGMANSDLYFELRNVKTGKYYPRLYLQPKNGYENAIIANLEPGEYGITLHIRTKKYNWEYTTYPEVKFSIFNLELDRYEIEDNPQYEYGVVNFKMNVFLKGNEDGLKGIQQFGYYIKYANAIDYRVVNNLSSIFESTPLTYELSIPRDGFSDETINYTTFEAKPSNDYYIGVYVVLKNGNIVTFDEEIIEELVYCKKPEIQFTSAHVKNTDVIETYDNGNVRYKTYFTFDFNINGCVWIDYIQYTIAQSNVNNYWDPQYPQNDGNYTLDGWTEYTNSIVHNTYFTIYLINGGTLNSRNGLQLSCEGGSGSMSVTGGNTRSLSNSFNTINTSTSIDRQSK